MGQNRLNLPNGAESTCLERPGRVESQEENPPAVLLFQTIKQENRKSGGCPYWNCGWQLNGWIKRDTWNGVFFIWHDPSWPLAIYDIVRWQDGLVLINPGPPFIENSSNFLLYRLAGSNDNPLSRFRQPTAGGKWLPLCGNIGRIKGCCLLLKIFLIPRANLKTVFLVICSYCQP